MKTKTYSVQSPIRHNGKDYTSGPIDLADEHAQPLLAAGVISDDVAEEAAPGGEGDGGEGTGGEGGDANKKPKAEKKNAKK